MTALVLLFMIVAPIVLLAWGIRAVRAWVGPWRLVPIGPLSLLVAAGITVAVGIRDDNIAHGPWLVLCFGLIVLASLVAYIASELHQVSDRRANISTAPPTEC
jgi:hypothetical protein